jgi:hypothetical protein
MGRREKKSLNYTDNNIRGAMEGRNPQAEEYYRNSRSSSIQNFITCGTMLGPGGAAGATDRGQDALNRDEAITDFERAVLNNEYLQIVKDPQFLRRNDVNFLNR